MSRNCESAVTRRRVLLSLGFAVLGLAALPTVFIAAEAEAQTAGMERRRERAPAGMSGATNGVPGAMNDAKSGAIKLRSSSVPVRKA
jgi:hypothetical protein